MKIKFTFLALSSLFFLLGCLKTEDYELPKEFGDSGAESVEVFSNERGIDFFAEGRIKFKSREKFISEVEGFGESVECVKFSNFILDNSDLKSHLENIENKDLFECFYVTEFEEEMGYMHLAVSKNIDEAYFVHFST